MDHEEEQQRSHWKVVEASLDEQRGHLEEVMCAVVVVVLDGVR